MRQEVFELHALLSAVKEAPPYVMAGQSLGGLLVRLYAEARPGDVAGVVLVDPTHESGVLGSGRYGGIVRLREKAAGRPVPAPRRSLAPATPEDPTADYMAEEFQLLYLARQRVPRTLGQRPLVVLAAGKRPAPPPGIAEDVWKTLRDERDEQVRDLVDLSSNARFVRDPASGHAIHRDNPALVARSIEDVLDAVVNGTRLEASRP
jgi:pimeloyl-ACP methyl ester carboxylesterase